MQELSEIASCLNSEQLSVIKKNIQNSEGALAKILIAAIDKKPFPTANQLKLNYSSFNKTKSLANSLFFDLCAKQLNTDLQEVELIRELIFKSHVQTALKFYNQLHKKYVQFQKWLLLEHLYIEGFRIAHVTNNKKLLVATIKFRNDNIERYTKYVHLSGLLMTEIIAHEGYDVNKNQAKIYLQKLKQIQLKVFQLKHYTLIHNVLYIEYMFLSRFTSDTNKLNDCVKKIELNLYNNHEKFDSLTAETAELNIINFYSIYNVSENPLKIAESFNKKITKSNSFLKSNFYLAMMEYSALTENKKQYDYWSLAFSNLEDSGKFSVYKTITEIIKCFAENKFSEMKEHFNLFMQHPSRFMFPDMQYFVRLLDLYVQFFTKSFDYDLILSSIKTLKIYAERNLNKSRHFEDFELLHYLEKLVKTSHKKKKLPEFPIKKFIYRNTYFLNNQIQKRLFIE